MSLRPLLQSQGQVSASCDEAISGYRDVSHYRVFSHLRGDCSPAPPNRGGVAPLATTYH
jgi:hypothetical protein